MSDCTKKKCGCEYCCRCYKGDKGDPGPQGIPGEKGDPGPQGIPGEKGDAFATLYGVFYGFPTGPISGGGIFNPTVVPVSHAAGINSPDAFVLNSDGTITLNESGMYLITSRIQVELGYRGNFCIKYNDNGAIRNTLNSSTVLNGGTAMVTTVAALNAGNRISNAYITTDPIYFAPYIEQVRSPTSTITLMKIADIPGSFDMNELNDSSQESMQTE